ncbi:M16 family metallopeptidase [Thermaurantiacus sp.]
MSQVETSRLANGLTVATIAMAGLRTAAVGLCASVGARHEEAAENGIAHLFEHMLFKGTEVRDARGLAEAIEDVGGALNAWTSRDMTLFHARVMGADLPLAVSLLAEMVTRPRFAEADLALEKQVVDAEIREALDAAEDRVFDLLQEAAFPDQPLGRPILGTPATLATLSTTDLQWWRDRTYRGPGLALVAAGAVTHADVKAAAEALLCGLPADPPAPFASGAFAGGVRSERRRADVTQIAIGLPGVSVHAANHYAAELFTTALGGGASSRLFQELREARGLAYSVSASHTPFADVGLATLHLATRPEDAERAAALALEVAWKAARDLTPAELARARTQLKAGLLMGLEGCTGQASWIGQTLLTHGRPIAPEEVEAVIDSVSLEDARAAGAAMLAGPVAMASIGPRPLKRLP